MHRGSPWNPISASSGLAGGTPALGVFLFRLRQPLQPQYAPGRVCTLCDVHPRERDRTEKEFLNDLFEAKLKYVTTRPCWNEPQAKPKLY